MTATHTLLKRSIDAAYTLAEITRRDDEPRSHRIPPVAALIFLLTCAGFFAILFAVTYTYGHLIPTLCMVESASSNAYVPIESVEPADDAPPAYSEDSVPKPTDLEVNLVRTQPITASLRGTVSHLKAKAGFWSRFRGLSVYLVWNFVRSIIIGMLSATSNSAFLLIFAAVLAEVALVRLTISLRHM